ncbi:MAG: hypothetical protein R3E66_06420 [bacterium]
MKNTKNVLLVLAAAIGGLAVGSMSGEPSSAQLPTTTSADANEYRCIGNNEAPKSGLEVSAQVRMEAGSLHLSLQAQNLDPSELRAVHEVAIVDPFGRPADTAELSPSFAVAAGNGHSQNFDLPVPEVDGYYTVIIRTATGNGEDTTRLQDQRVWLKVADGIAAVVDRDEYEANSGENEAQSI